MEGEHLQEPPPVHQPNKKNPARFNARLNRRPSTPTPERSRQTAASPATKDEHRPDPTPAQTMHGGHLTNPPPPLQHQRDRQPICTDPQKARERFNGLGSRQHTSSGKIQESRISLHAATTHRVKNERPHTNRTAASTTHRMARTD